MADLERIRGTPRVISDCHFSVQLKHLNHFIPGFLSCSVAVLLKWRSDITPGTLYHTTILLERWFLESVVLQPQVGFHIFKGLGWHLRLARSVHMGMQNC